MEDLIKFSVDIDSKTRDKFIQICSEIKPNINNLSLLSGIGDIILYKMTNPTMKVYVNLYHILHCKPHPDNIKHSIFNYELLSKLFKDVVYYYDKKYEHLPIEYGSPLKYNILPHFEIKHKLNFDYIVIHTKMRFWYAESDYVDTRNKLKSFFSTYICPLPIVVLGDRELSKNTQTNDMPFMSTIYDEIMLLKINNKVIDLSVDEIYNCPDINQFENDISIINHAKLNIGVGLGGQFCMNLAFSNKSIYYVPKNIHNEIKYMKKEGIEVYHKIDDFIENFPTKDVLPISNSGNILYLLNHKTLTDFEVPILINKGFSCFIPKIYKTLDKINSINNLTTNFYDNFLKINIKDVKELNKIDWFLNKKLSKEQMNIVNKNFSVIFITLLTTGEFLQQLLSEFKGNMYYRFFGLASTASYVPFLTKNVLKHPKVKYIFSYDSILPFENTLSKHFTIDNSYYVPLGLSNNLMNNIRDTYKPLNRKIAFVCSRIDDGIGTYYHRIYTNFVTNFKQYEFIIFGKNNSTVEHFPYIKNNLDNENYYLGLASCMCMFYHSEEERHLHYHPLEAIIIGIPVLFLEKSLLHIYLDDSRGKCKNINEVKSKLSNILSGDKELIKSIIDCQNRVIDKLTVEYNSNIFDDVLK